MDPSWGDLLGLSEAEDLFVKSFDKRKWKIKLKTIPVSKLGPPR